MTPSPASPELVLEAMLNLEHPVKVETANWARQYFADVDMIENDKKSVFSRDVWRDCAAMGIVGSSVPTAFGGAGDDLITTVLKFEGFGLGCPDNGLSFAIASQELSFLAALQQFGSSKQMADILPGLCAGDLIGGFAITEPEAGSDSYSMQTTAEETADGYLLNGHKAHITLGPVADVVLVFAKTRPDAGRWGISAFLVHTDRDGVECTANYEKMGLRTTPFGDMFLDGYLAAESDRLGPEGAGVSIFAKSMEAERGLIGASKLGSAERVIGDAVTRARSREQFGQPIGSFQAVSHRLVDMQVRHESARLLLYKAAGLVTQGRQVTKEAAMAKLVASEAVKDIALDASLVHGARGYVTSYEVEREVRDALGALVPSGTTDIQRNVIARMMGMTK